MAVAAANSVFSIPYRYLWSTNFSGDLEGIDDRPTGLARFVGDEQNRLLKILSDEVPLDYVGRQHDYIWPLVLFGSSGTGKTSLALTIAADLDQRSDHGQRLKPIVLTAADFDRRFRSALATDTITDFRRKFLRCSVWVLDDVHLLATKQAAQQELLQIMNQLDLRNRPLIVTMDRDPQLCSGLIPQLVSRFCGGLSLPVQQPGQSAREVIIRDLCRIHRLELTSNAIDLLVNRLNVTVPKMVHFFGQLKTACYMANKRLSNKNHESNDFVLIEDAFITRIFERTDEEIQKLSKLINRRVAREFKLTIKDLRSDSRKQSIVLARGVAIYLNRLLLGTSFLKLGTVFGNRDHSTIMHAHRKIEMLFVASDNDNKNISSATAASFAAKQRIEKLKLQLTNLFAGEVTPHVG